MSVRAYRAAKRRMNGREYYVTDGGLPSWMFSATNNLGGQFLTPEGSLITDGVSPRNYATISDGSLITGVAINRLVDGAGLEDEHLNIDSTATTPQAAVSIDITNTQGWAISLACGLPNDEFLDFTAVYDINLYIENMADPSSPASIAMYELAWISDSSSFSWTSTSGGTDITAATNDLGTVTYANIAAADLNINAAGTYRVRVASLIGGTVQPNAEMAVTITVTGAPT